MKKLDELKDENKALTETQSYYVKKKMNNLNDENTKLKQAYDVLYGEVIP